MSVSTISSRTLSELSGDAMARIDDIFDANGRPLGFYERPTALNNTGAESALESAAATLSRREASAVVLLLPTSEIAAFSPEVRAQLEAKLPAACQRRLDAFTHPKRREQSFIARLAALCLAAAFVVNRSRDAGQAEMLAYTEEPPYGPVLVDASAHRIAWLTLAHTTGGAAAALSLSPMGIDLERPRPVKRLAGVADFAFGEKAAHILEAARGRLSETRFSDIFFALWGIKESEIKMNRTPQSLSTHPRAKMSLEEAPQRHGAALFVRTPDGQSLCPCFYAANDLRLSVLPPIVDSKLRATFEAPPAVFELQHPSPALFFDALDAFAESQSPP